MTWTLEYKYKNYGKNCWRNIRPDLLTRHSKQIKDSSCLRNDVCSSIMCTVMEEVDSVKQVAQGCTF